MSPPPAPLPAQTLREAMSRWADTCQLAWRPGAAGSPPALTVMWQSAAGPLEATLQATADRQAPWTCHLPGRHLTSIREALTAAALRDPLRAALRRLATADADRQRWRANPADSPLGWPADATQVPWSAAPEVHAVSEPWLAAWQRWLGEAPVLVAHPDGGPPSVRVPPPPAGRTPEEQAVAAGFFLDAGAHLLGHTHVAARFRALGYGCDADGRVRTVPTPEGFMLRAEALGLQPPFRPKLRRGWWALIRERVWLEAWAGGELAIHVAPAGFYRSTTWAGRPSPQRLGWLRELWIGHHVGFAHDIGVHAAATHALPWRCALEIRAEVRRALAARGPWRLRQLGPVLRFFEDDLTARCLARWRAIGDADYAEVWRRCDQDPALALLETRLHEARSAS